MLIVNNNNKIKTKIKTKMQNSHSKIHQKSFQSFNFASVKFRELKWRINSRET